MEFTQYIKPEMLVLVPVLWLIGNALKRTPKVPDWLIPYVLGIMGVAGCARPEILRRCRYLPLLHRGFWWQEPVFGGTSLSNRWGNGMKVEIRKHEIWL